MKFTEVNGDIYVLKSFLEKLGVDAQTVDNGALRNRQGRSKHYAHIKDHIDKRRIWIKYNSIPNLMFLKYNLPPEEILRKKYDLNRKDKHDNLIMECFEFAYNAGYRQYLNEYKGCFVNSHEFINFARTHSIFKEILKLRQFGIPFSKMLKPYRQFQSLVFDTDNLRSFYRKIKKFEEEGAACLIHRMRGHKKGNAKVTKAHEKKLKSLYADGKQFSGREIHMKMNEWCVLNGYPKISLSSIKKILSDPYIQNICNTRRNGKEWYQLNIEPFRLREDPEENGELWQLDGSRLQIPYLENNNKIAFLNLFVVMDVHSRKIVGYSLGKSENHVLVIEAIKNAILYTGFTPNTAVIDNGPAFKHEKFQKLEEQMSYFGTKIIRHAPGNPRQKGHVERFFSTFQTTVCKHFTGYIGEGIKSKRVNGRPSKKKITESLKKKNLKTYNELEDLTRNMIDKYNEQKISEINSSPDLKFAIAKQNEYARDINENNFALLFWSRVAEYHIRNSMVILTEGSHRNQTFQYIIHDRKSKFDLNSRRLIVLYQKDDRSRIKLFDQDENYIMDIMKSEKVKIVQSRDKIQISKREVSTTQSSSKDNKQTKKGNVFKVPATFDLLLVKTKGDE